jgi:hypothetical protein
MATNINGFFPGEIYPSTTVAGCIDIFENVWPNCDETIENIEKECSNSESLMNWWPAEITNDTGLANYSSDIRTNFDIGITHLAKITNNTLAQNLHNQFYILLLAAGGPYAKKHNIQNLYHEGYNLLKYKEGQSYGLHYDGVTSLKRAVSAIVYLNDDYEGGYLEFPNFDVRIKPEKGMLILFPSNFAYAHIASPVIRGEKYAMVTWLKDVP